MVGRERRKEMSGLVSVEEERGEWWAEGGQDRDCKDNGFEVLAEFQILKLEFDSEWMIWKINIWYSECQMLKTEILRTQIWHLIPS